MNNNNSSTQDDSLPPVGSQPFNGNTDESNSRRSGDSQGSKNSKKVSSGVQVGPISMQI